jgi:hypothetical protein
MATHPRIIEDEDEKEDEEDEERGVDRNAVRHYRQAQPMNRALNA